MMNSGSDKNVLLFLQKRCVMRGIDWEPLETRTTYDWEWECDCEREGIFGPRAQGGFFSFFFTAILGLLHSFIVH